MFLTYLYLFKWDIFLAKSTILFILFIQFGVAGVGGYPNCYGAKQKVYRGQVASLLKGQHLRQSVSLTSLSLDFGRKMEHPYRHGKNMQMPRRTTKAGFYMARHVPVRRQF